MHTWKPALISLASIIILSCGAPSPSNQSVAKPVGGPPMAETLLALEKRANEAYILGNGKYFEGFLSGKVVMTGGGQRIAKADIVKIISGVKCDVKEGWSLTDPRVLRINDDAYVITYQTAMDGTCTSGSKAEKLPSPVRVATLWVRSGDKWEAAFHGENPIVRPKNLSTGGEMNSSQPAAPAPESNAEPLMAAEHAVWQAWKEKDAQKIDALTAREVMFVNIFGTHFSNKAQTIQDWTSNTCMVKGFSMTNGVSTFFSPTVGVLTLTASLDATCGGQKAPPIYGTTVYVKDGDAWKWAFGFNSSR